ncbi:MAG: tetratricopeptide repeat protein, partial [Bacteroidota bacterium]
MKNLLLTVFILLGTFQLNAQKDSLMHIWKDSSQKDTVRFTAIYDLIWEEYMFSQPDSAEFYALQMKDFAMELDIDEYRLTAMNAIGVSYAIRDQQTLAAEYFEACVALSDSLGKAVDAAGISLNLGVLYQDIGDIDGAMHSYSKSLKYARGANDTIMMAMTLTNIGTIQFEQGKFSDAMDSFFEALGYREATNDSVQAASIQAEIGLVHERIGNLDIAEKYISEAIEVIKTSNNKIALTDTYLNLGRLQVNQDKNDQAFISFKNALQIAEETDNQGAVASSLSELGRIYSSRNELVLATQSLQKSRGITKSIGLIDNYIVATHYYSGVLEKQGRMNEALELYLETYLLSTESDLKNSMGVSAEALSKLYKKRGDYEEALKYAEVAASIQKDILNDQNLKTILQSEINYEYDKKAFADSLAFANRDALKQQQFDADLEVSRLRQYLLAAGLILFLIIGLFLYQRFKATQKQRDAEAKNANRLEELNRIRGTFFANISHEFRTPLSVIDGMNELIQQDPEKWQERGSSLIQRNVKNLMGLVNQILDLQKLEKSELQLNLIQCDVVQLTQA